MVEQGRLAEQREGQAVDRSPEVRRVADVVEIPPGHVPAVQQIQRGENIAGDGNRDEIEVVLIRGSKRMEAKRMADTAPEAPTAL